MAREVVVALAEGAGWFGTAHAEGHCGVEHLDLSTGPLAREALRGGALDIRRLRLEADTLASSMGLEAPTPSTLVA